MTSIDECDPADDSFGKSLTCQKVYKQRDEQLRLEVEALARSSEEKRAEKSTVEEQLKEARDRRLRLDRKSREIETELQRLKDTNAIEETKYVWLRDSLAARNREIQKVGEQLVKMEESQNAGLQDTIDKLQEEERELEQLLLSLAE